MLLLAKLSNEVITPKEHSKSSVPLTIGLNSLNENSLSVNHSLSMNTPNENSLSKIYRVYHKESSVLPASKIAKNE